MPFSDVSDSETFMMELSGFIREYGKFIISFFSSLLLVRPEQ